MRSSYRHWFKLFTLVTEFTIIHFSCKLAYYFKYSELGNYEEYYVSFFLIFNLAWMGASLLNNSYDYETLTRLKTFVRTFISTSFMHVFIVMLYIVSVKASYLSRYYLFYVYATSLLSIVSFRALLILAYKYYTALTYYVRPIVLIGPESAMADLHEFFDSQHTRIYRFLADLNPHLSESERHRLLHRTMEDIKAFCVSEAVEEVYLSLPLADEELLSEFTDFADDHFIYFRVVTDFSVLRHKRVNVDFMGHVPVISMRREPLKALVNRVLKRGFDVAFSLGVLLLLLPLVFPFIALAIKLDSPGPIFFRQLRSGKRNREFWVYKFRTMYVNHEADRLQAQPNDCRVTRVGRFLRRSSLDELPQFLNVLRGDMSVVGPRPHMLKHTYEYSHMIDKYLLRHFISPGITGHAQVHGLRGETSDPQMMRKRIEYDNWYVENWSLLLDVKIVMQTVRNLFRKQEGAY
jgi:putative colanic acid biosysnthesis UDP-glucose lipid carrier transferase